MTVYIRGETLEVPHHSIGFLLEGFIKTHGLQEELITSPAALLPLHGNLSFWSPEASGSKVASFSHQGSRYQVETRARVIVFDIAAFEADNALQRLPSSVIPHSAEHLFRSLSRQHSGLMSWPEHFFKPKKHEQTPGRTSQIEQTNSLSERAMRLSIFGSMVDMRYRRRFFTLNDQGQASHSQSYPTVPSNQGHSIVSIRSEGHATMRKSLQARRFSRKIPKPLSQRTEAKERESLVADDTSEESSAEDEVIVRIDSPSTLSFHQPT